MERPFDPPGTALSEVTFCVLDVETTGSVPGHDGITEVGAVKVRGGEPLGTFQSFVHPGCAIAPQVTVLTGITQAMVHRAPRPEGVLAALAEFAAGTVLVGHNLRFDLSFLEAATLGAPWSPAAHPHVDTLPLARRLLRDEVPDCRLATLAERFALAHPPRHRALDDALATTDLLHLLLERGASYGVHRLDDLLALPRLARHPLVAKLSLTRDLPRAPGVYLFRDRAGQVLHVGRADDIRARVRAYFGGEGHSRGDALLRETTRVDHQVCRTPLEAAVVEVRLVHTLLPRFDRRSSSGDGAAYVKLTLREAYPRLAVVRAPRPDGATYLGPLGSRAVAGRVADAIATAGGLRRCTGRVVPGRPAGDVPCPAARPGEAPCPCAGGITAAEYAPRVARVMRGIRVDARLLLDPLRDRMAELAAARRFEEAATVRAAAEALTATLERQRCVDGLRRAGRVELTLPDGVRIRLRDGLLAEVVPPGEDAPPPTAPGSTPPGERDDPAPPLPRHLAEEVACIATWLDRDARRIRLQGCSGEWSSPVRPVGPCHHAPALGPDGEPSGQQLGASSVHLQHLHVPVGR